jgi:hypothetical protein
LQADGTFTYTAPATGSCTGSFTALANGTSAIVASITQCDATSSVTGCLGGAPTANADSYTSPVGPTAILPAKLHIAPPGVLANDTDPSGLPLTVANPSTVSCAPAVVAVNATTSVPAGTGICTVQVQADGSFTALITGASGAGGYAFTYSAQNSQGTPSSAMATASLVVPAASNLAVNLLDAISGQAIASKDYRWIIEEDRTFYVDPVCQINSTDPTLRPANCPPLPVQSLGYNFHTANMPVVATGCVGPVSCESGQTLLGAGTACDQGNGVCQSGTGAATQKSPLDPSQVALDPNKRYYLSVMPADGINPTINGGGAPVADATAPGGTRPFRTTGGANNLGDCTDFTASVTSPGNCGHTMGGAQISGALVAANGTTPTQVNIKLQRTPLPTAQIAVFVFQDDSPLNGENDPSGPPGNYGPAPNEAGLGGFNIVLFDQAGGLGDNTGPTTGSTSR